MDGLSALRGMEGIHAEMRTVSRISGSSAAF